MPIEQRDNFGDVGVPHQWSDTVAAELENLVTGHYPEISGRDFPIAANHDLPALSVVALNGSGRLVQAEFNPQQPGAHASATVNVGSATTAVTIDGVAYSVSAGNANARAAALAAQINEDVDGAAYATVAAAVITVTARAPGSSGNVITLTETGNGSASAATLGGGTGGNVPLGVLVQNTTTGAGETPSVGVWLTGVFNPDRLIWHPSFASDSVKARAFDNARAMTQITLRRIRANTLV